MSLTLQEFSWGQIQNYMGMTLDGGSSIIGGAIRTGKTDGTYNQMFHDFADINDGFFPQGTMVLGTDNNFYGMITNGGEGKGYGVIFKISPAGLFTKLRGLSTSDGGNPAGGLIQGTDSSFYGLCFSGGTHAYGTIFKITSSGVFTKLHDLSINDGVNPYGALVQGKDGDFYGTCFGGGSNSFGTIFKINSAGVFTKLKDLTSTDGINPNGNLVEYNDGNFYGMCSSGGSYGFGTIFKISPSGIFSKIWDLNTLDGKYPFGSLTLDVDGTFYGMCSSGGRFYDAINNVNITDNGTIFKITPLGAFSKIWDFNEFGGGGPRGNLVKSSDGNFYGVGSNGPVFSISTAGTYTAVAGFGLTRGSLILFDNFTQTITGLSLDSLALCAPKKLVLTTVSSSSGLPVTFSSSDLSVATVSGNTITVLSVGVTTITAFQPGNGLYEAAKPFMQILKVIQEPDMPTLTLSSIPSGPACDKENISFISNVTNIGTNPVYSLLRNGDFITSNSGQAFNSTVLGNGDIITVKMSSISTGCLVTIQDSITITIKSLPSVMISGFISVCNGSSSVLTASGAKFYRWNTGSADSTSNVFPTATSTFVVTGTGSNGCSNSVKVLITVPGIGLDLFSFNQICNTVGSIALTGGIPKEGGTYWYENAPITKLDISKGGEYVVAYRYKNPYINSCLNTIFDTISVQVCLTICERPNPPCYCTNTCPPPFKIYTAITPNGDTYNDTWIIDSLYTPNQITILDKWGNEIYHTENYMQDWNGTKDEKQLPPGIYFYIAEMGLDKRRFSGNVSIIR